MSLNLGLIVEKPAPGARHRRRPAGGQERRAVRAGPAGRAGGWAVATLGARHRPGRRVRLRAVHRRRRGRRAGAAGCRSAVRRRHAVDGGDAAAAAARRAARAQGRRGCAPSTRCRRTTATWSSPASAASARSSPASSAPSASPSPRSTPTPSRSTSCASSAPSIFYGDASRPEILEAAQTGKARAFVLAIDDVEASLRTAQHGAAALSERADLRPLPPPPAHPPADGRRHQDHPPRDVPLLARPDARGAARAWPARARGALRRRHLPRAGPPPAVRGLQALHRHREAAGARQNATRRSSRSCSRRTRPSKPKRRTRKPPTLHRPGLCRCGPGERGA